MDNFTVKAGIRELVKIPVENILLEGLLNIPEDAIGIVIFSHGSGSSRHSPRNNYVANVLHDNNIGTLLINLLTEKEDEIYETRFNIDMLTNRLVAIAEWILEDPGLKNMNLGFFGSSTGSASALRAAAKLGNFIKAVVSRGGRPDLAINELQNIKAPVLLIVGGNDLQVLVLNQKAYKKINSSKRLDIIPGAGHLFEEPEVLENVSELASDWFAKYLK